MVFLSFYFYFIGFKSHFIYLNYHLWCDLKYKWANGCCLRPTDNIYSNIMPCGGSNLHFDEMGEISSS